MKDARSSTTYNIPLHIWLNFKIFCTNWSLKSIDHCYWINVHYYIYTCLECCFFSAITLYSTRFRCSFYFYRILRMKIIQCVVSDRFNLNIQSDVKDEPQLKCYNDDMSVNDWGSSFVKLRKLFRRFELVKNI